MDERHGAAAAPARILDGGRAAAARVARIARRELAALFAADVVWWVLGAFACQALCVATLGLDDVLVARGGWSALFLVLLVPAVTMRLIARERTDGTLELLATLPLKDVEVVLGKFSAAWALVAGAESLSWLLSTVLAALSGHSRGAHPLGSLSGLWLMAAALLAIGLSCSALARSQSVAYLSALTIGLALWALVWLGPMMPRAWAPWVEYLSVSHHQTNLARGDFDSRDVVYYLTLTIGALTVATGALFREPRRRAR